MASSDPAAGCRSPHRKEDVTQLQHDLAAVFDAAIMAHAQWAVVVRSAESGETLYQLNPQKLMMPASNMKIVTLATAANTLGWDHRFTTTLETAAPVEGGVLRGDLVIRGGGDPTINARGNRAQAVFASWIEALRAAGIRDVTGRIVGDDQAFEEEGLGAGWAWDYLQYGYAAPVGALQYNEDNATLSVLPGPAAGAPAVVSLSPGSGFTVVNRAVTAAAGTPESIDYRRYLDRPVLEIFGAVPLAEASALPARTVAREVAVVNPTIFFAQAFKDALIAAGIAVSGEAADFDDLAGEPAAALPRRTLATAESPALRDIASVLMKASQNLYAETLLKAAGAAAGGLGTTAAGKTAVVNTLRGWKLDDKSLVMLDGSGLSRYNYVTADLLASLLGRMYADPQHREPFGASLALAGRDGTMANRLRRTRAEGNAIVKTGSISNVRALSGYVRARNGEVLIFSILANHFSVPAATVNWISDLAVEILANFGTPPATR